MSKLYYICKYTPVELLKACGAETAALNHMAESFGNAETAGHANLCGFGKTILENVLAGNVREIVLVNCCDTIRSVYDILKEKGGLDFIYFIDLPHENGECAIDRFAFELSGLLKSYEEYSGRKFDLKRFFSAFEEENVPAGDYIALAGARCGDEFYASAGEAMPYPVKNLTCVSGRSVSCHGDGTSEDNPGADMQGLLKWYAKKLICQYPCMRMNDTTGRRSLLNDPALKGIIYHTIKFCDYYGFEYAQLNKAAGIPFLKLETDFSTQSAGQLLTRLDAFAEQFTLKKRKTGSKDMAEKSGKKYFIGIDSGSTSTEAVIMDGEKNIVSAVMMPTGAGAKIGAEKAVADALLKAGLSAEDIAGCVSTGYGRGTIGADSEKITEISCHAKGAFYLNSSVRTIIDIGGQDSKVIRIDDKGSVLNFVMNDKCAAGTGRFLEMMARTLELSLDELSKRGMEYKEDITISSMCTVFAESEVVSLRAENKSVDDIVHGLNNSVAAKIKTLLGRAGLEENLMMTGGVAHNKGVIKAIEEKTGHNILVDERAQFCGAIGAAVFAAEG